MLTQLQAGDLIADRFRVESLLGEGGIARVYKVRHIRLGSVHAVKILTLTRPALADRLLLEGRIQAQLSHPNLVRVTDVVQHNGQPCLVMEYVAGTQLGALLAQDGAMEVDPALTLITSVLSGVAAAHDAGVLHRDLKPANILLSRRGKLWVPKVSDFGIAKIATGGLRDGETRAGVQMGTPGYMAPEQIEDSAQVDHRADIFALGAILYEMICGARPFEAETTFRTLRATIDGKLVPVLAKLPDCPPHVAQAIERCLQTEMQDRYQDCHQLADALLADHPHLRAQVRRRDDQLPLAGLHRPELTSSTPSTPALIPHTAVMLGSPSQPTLAPDEETELVASPPSASAASDPVAPAGAGVDDPGATGGHVPIAGSEVAQLLGSITPSRDGPDGPSLAGQLSHLSLSPAEDRGLGTAGPSLSDLGAAGTPAGGAGPAGRGPAGRGPAGRGPAAITGSPPPTGSGSPASSRTASSRTASPRTASSRPVLWGALVVAVAAVLGGGWVLTHPGDAQLAIEDLQPPANVGPAVGTTAGTPLDSSASTAPTDSTPSASTATELAPVSPSAQAQKAQAAKAQAQTEQAQKAQAAKALAQKAQAAKAQAAKARAQTSRDSAGSPAVAKTAAVAPAAVAPAAVAPAAVAPAAVAPAAVAPAAVAPAAVAPTAEAPATVAPAAVTPAAVTPAAVAPAAVAPAAVTPAAVTPAAVTPAAVTPAAVTPAAVTPAAVTPAAVAPTITGTWTGVANDKPLTIKFTSQDGERLVGELRFSQGAIERVARISGTLDAENNRLNFHEEGGSGLSFTGVVRGTGMMGTYSRSGRGSALSWSARRQ